MKHTFRLLILITVLSAATALSYAQFGWGISDNSHRGDPFYFNNQQHCRDTLSLLSNRYGRSLSPGSLNTASFFFSNLSRRQNLNSRQLYGHLDQYAASGGTLSPEVLNLSLEGTSQAAASLLETAIETSRLVNAPAPQNGLHDHDQVRLSDDLRNDLKDQLKRIRKLAKKIRSDSNLEFVEGDRDDQIRVPEPARSLDGLRTGVDDLHRLALQIDRDMETLTDLRHFKKLNLAYANSYRRSSRCWHYNFSCFSC